MTEPEAADPRRADLGADAAGGADALRHAAQARRRGLLDPLHLAQARRDPRRSATTARCCAAARSRARSIRRKETNASLSRLMIGAEPPQLQHREARAGRGRARRCATSRCAKEDPFGTALEAISLRGPRRRDRRHRRRLGQRPAGADGGALGRGRARARRARSACSTATSRATRRAARRARRPALRARGAARPRRRADALAGAEHAADAHPRRRRRRLAAHRRRRRARRGADPPLQRQGRRPGLGGQEPVGRQPAEVHRRPRDRRRPEAARSSRSRPGASTSARRRRSAASCWRCATTAAPSSSSARSSTSCSRSATACVVIAQGRVSPSVRDRRGDDRADRRMDERPLGLRSDSERCCGLRRAREPSRAMSIASPLIALAITVVIGTLPVRPARQGSAARPRVFFVEPVKSVYALIGAGGQGDAAAADRARPRGLLSLQRLEHRRRRPVHRRRDRSRAASRCRRRRATRRLVLRAGAASPASSAAWPGRRSSRCCATASTPTRSWSA